MGGCRNKYLSTPREGCNGLSDVEKRKGVRSYGRLGIGLHPAEGPVGTVANWLTVVTVIEGALAFPGGEEGCGCCWGYRCYHYPSNGINGAMGVMNPHCYERVMMRDISPEKGSSCLVIW